MAGFSDIASGIIKLSYGGSQVHDANRRLKKLGELANENIAPEVLENKTNSLIGAETGLPAAQYAQAMKNIQRQQASAIKSGQDRRMAGSLIGGVQQNTNDALLKLDTQNALARERKQKELMGVNNTIGMWRNRIYNNYRSKWIADQNYALSEKGAGEANQIAGLDSAVSGASSLVSMGGGGGGGMGGGSFGGAGASGSWG